MNENNKKNEIITLSEETKTKLSQEKKQYIAARSSKLQPGTAEKILQKIKEKYELESTEEALAVISVLFQQGGTARGCDGNMSITLFEKQIKLADIRKIMKQESCAKSERKLARTLADQIQEVALIMEIPGNLYLKIQKQDLNKPFTISEKVWLSDFQSDNENCPAELRSLILNTFQRKKNDSNSQKKKK